MTRTQKRDIQETIKTLDAIQSWWKETGGSGLAPYDPLFYHPETDRADGPAGATVQRLLRNLRKNFPKS
jgi:hypothetical protein